MTDEEIEAIKQRIREEFEGDSPRDIALKLWNLRKWIYDHGEQHIWDLPEDKQELLTKLRRVFDIRLPNSNSIEYNFGSIVTSWALGHYADAGDIEGIDTIFEETRGFRFVNSFYDSTIIRAYLECNEVEKAQNVVNYLEELGEDWAMNRAKYDKQLIDEYKRKSRADETF